MKALIFAAGVGSRLKPWTDSHPKALVHVGDEPMLGHVIHRLTRAGIKEIIVNVHHFAEQIIDYIRSNNFDAEILISDESRLLLETGGGLRKVLPLLGNEPVLIHNADILTDFPVERMLEFHDNSRCDATLLTSQRDTSRKFIFNSEGLLKGWINIAKSITKPSDLSIKSDYVQRAFNGVHIIEPRLYERLQQFRPDDTPFSIVDFYLHNVGSAHINMYDMPQENYWFDIGKPEALDKARNFLINNNIQYS